MTIILIGFLGAVVSAVVGTLWYSGSTPMGRWHMQSLGFDKLSDAEKAQKIAEAKPNMWKSYLAQMFLSFLTALFIAFVASYTVQNGGSVNAVYGYMVMIWAVFIIPMIGQNLLWSNCERSLAWKRFFSDSASNLITLLVVAFISTLFF